MVLVSLMPEAMSIITLSPMLKDVVATEPRVYADALGKDSLSCQVGSSQLILH